MLRVQGFPLVLVLVLAVTQPCLAYPPTASNWSGSIFPVDSGGGFSFGARPGCVDGYDGQTVLDIPNMAGVFMPLYRSNGDNWEGPTGFYFEDYEAPIPDGGSKTWSGIRLWVQNYTPYYGDRVIISFMPKLGGSPQGWWGKLTIDYVPEHLNWTGPYEWVFPLYQSEGYNVPALPVPITNDPFNPDNVTRMHLTVYTYPVPVPEPSSLLALTAFVAPFAGVAIRRRRTTD